MAQKKTTKSNSPVVRQVNVEALFSALYSKGEAKLSDFYVDVKAK